jgi:hypothetical protein
MRYCPPLLTKLPPIWGGYGGRGGVYPCRRGGLTVPQPDTMSDPPLLGFHTIFYPVW